MVQTKAIIKALGIKCEIKKISTRGDKITDVALANVEGKGFFTREIDEALLAGEIDFAVHSLKDLPTDLPDGLVISAIPKRESALDALVGSYNDLNKLPQNARVGTSSLRRRAEVLRHRPDIKILELRGNVDTRIRKLSEGNYNAIIVAEAGLKRLGYEDYYTLSPEVFIPAVCQGALSVTTRSSDEKIMKLMSKIEDPITRITCEAERNFLTALNAGCQIPAGAFSTINPDDRTYTLIGFISSIDGKQFVEGMESSDMYETKNAAIRLAKKLLHAGGSKILEKIRR
jgi:hydroxymethylbilane synthase